MEKNNKIIIGLAHDYLSFTEGDVEIQLPIIYVNELFRKMNKSPYVTEGNVRNHSYQADYNIDVELWVQDLGNWQLKPQLKRLIKEIKLEDCTTK